VVEENLEPVPPNDWEDAVEEFDEVEHLHATISALREELVSVMAELEDIIMRLEATFEG